MQRSRKSLDQIHTIRSLNGNDKRRKNSHGNVKVVGIKIDTQSKEFQDKIYYYKTDKNLKEGDKINAIMPTNGHPDCVVVEVDNISNAKYKRLKDLELFK